MRSEVRSEVRSGAPTRENPTRENQRGKRSGQREYIQVLRLLECFAFESVTWAVGEAVRLQAISFDAVKHLVLCRIESRPARLDLALYPHLPVAQVAMTTASEYLGLLNHATGCAAEYAAVHTTACAAEGVNNGNDFAGKCY